MDRTSSCKMKSDSQKKVRQNLLKSYNFNGSRKRCNDTSKTDGTEWFKNQRDSFKQPVNCKVPLQTVPPANIILLVTVIRSFEFIIEVPTEISCRCAKTWDLSCKNMKSFSNNWTVGSLNNSWLTVMASWGTNINEQLMNQLYQLDL